MDKIDTIQKDIGQIKIILAEQHISLKEHIRRTELLETALKPIEKHVAMTQGALKLIGFSIAFIEAIRLYAKF